MWSWPYLGFWIGGAGLTFRHFPLNSRGTYWIGISIRSRSCVSLSFSNRPSLARNYVHPLGRPLLHHKQPPRSWAGTIKLHPPKTAGLDPRPQVKTHEKLIPGRTRRAATNPRPPLESSRQGESRYLPGKILYHPFNLFFQNNFPNNVRTNIYPEESFLPRRILLYRGLRIF